MANMDHLSICSSCFFNGQLRSECSLQPISVYDVQMVPSLYITVGWFVTFDENDRSVFTREH